MSHARGAQPAATVAEVLFSQGFGTRRDCEARVRAGQLRIAGVVITDPGQAWQPVEGERYEVQGERWQHHTKACVMLHKPADTECSLQPQAFASVLSLLPEPLRRRGVQPVGRLDADTTGLLLLTDDGPLNHRLCSPRNHVSKVYRVTTRHALDLRQVDQLLAGVALRDDPQRPARALAVRLLTSHSLELEIDEGRYHQVKRMLAAVGNRVEQLHRSRFGPLELPADLAAGQWQWVDRAVFDRVASPAPTATPAATVNPSGSRPLAPAQPDPPADPPADSASWAHARRADR